MRNALWFGTALVWLGCQGGSAERLRECEDEVENLEAHLSVACEAIDDAASAADIRGSRADLKESIEEMESYLYDGKKVCPRGW